MAQRYNLGVQLSDILAQATWQTLTPSDYHLLILLGHALIKLLIGLYENVRKWLDNSFDSNNIPCLFKNVLMSS